MGHDIEDEDEDEIVVDQEVLDETNLLTRLQVVEKSARDALKNSLGSEQISLLSDMLVLIRAYRRKWHEAHDLKGALAGVKEFLADSWDEDDEEFDPSHGVSGRLKDHWCPTLIEEIEMNLEEDMVYMPHLIPQEEQKESA